MLSFVFLFKQKTAYEMRISDWSSDVCSSDLPAKVGASPLGNNRFAVTSTGYAPVEQPTKSDTTATVAKALTMPNFGMADPQKSAVLQRHAAYSCVRHNGRYADIGITRQRRDMLTEIGKESCRERVCPYGEI